MRILAISTALLTTAAALTAALPAHAAISCDTATTGGATFYDGPSASKKYDARFSNSASIPNLSTYTPQGAGTWYNWDGSGKNLLLVAAYREGADSEIYGIDPSTGSTVGVVAIAESHVGGITVSKGWAFVAGQGSSIRKYRLTELRDALKAAGTPYLAQVGTARDVAGSSFIGGYGDSLFAGTFNDTGRGTMYEYKIADDGTLTTSVRCVGDPDQDAGPDRHREPLHLQHVVRAWEPQQHLRGEARPEGPGRGRTELLPRAEHDRGHHGVQRNGVPGLRVGIVPVRVGPGHAERHPAHAQGIHLVADVAGALRLVRRRVEHAGPGPCVGSPDLDPELRAGIHLPVLLDNARAGPTPELERDCLLAIDGALVP